MSSESEETSVSATELRVAVRRGNRACLQAEGAALDEDEQADGDQDHGQQDVAPPAEGLGDAGRVATNRPAAHQTPTRTRKTTQYTIVPLVPTLVKTGT